MKSILIALALSATGLTAATTWTGSLNSSDLKGSRDWENTVSINWIVSEINPNLYRYEYEMTIPADTTLTDLTIELQGEPNLTANTTSVYYDSEWAPVWGSFNAKGRNSDNKRLWVRNGIRFGIPVSRICNHDNVLVPEPRASVLIGMFGTLLILLRHRADKYEY
jgi:hypothetical protein